MPVEIKSRIMEAPQIFKSGQIIHVDEDVLRKLPIQKAVHLKREQWVMVYQHSKQRSNYQVADCIYNNFKEACGRLNIQVEEPYWIELDQEDDKEELKHKLRAYMTESKDGIFRHPLICVAVLGYEGNYPLFKEVFQSYMMPSQVITRRNGEKFSLSKATNILRQINSKIGGDLFQLKFPQAVEKKRTMLIGIDVCHAGPNSIVGFSASTNKEMSQYYSEHIVQKKGQEIVQSRMKDALKSAIKVFADQHKNEYPTNFVIYRDGVGDAMRDQVLATEIPQFETAINEVYNKAAAKPQITVVVVNKRITQRFFVKDERGQLRNPPSGCIIDQGLVENEGNSGNPRAVFDFFLTPANTTQGCVLPTHFHVPKNDSDFTKIELQQLTFALCHFYFNWAGPIKVPAPCQYAHKIAEFYMITQGGSRRKHQQEPKSCKQEQFCLESARRECTPLNELLHFL